MCVVHVNHNPMEQSESLHIGQIEIMERTIIETEFTFSLNCIALT
jgi:hypothetical protein